ncbi:hypothetical protein AAIH70_16130 [Neorhizobium sp. BT27B]|uniref:hypothetical protein n=1 Tax=Neorhizobium sp. BT27B TaxID=3142625 RepID=UPI003D280ECE
MALLVSNKDADEMQKWIAIVEVYNASAAGSESGYTVKAVRNDETGETLLVLELKPQSEIG